MITDPKIIKAQEKVLKSDLLKIAKVLLRKHTVNKPKITNVKINGFQVVSIDDLGRYQRFYKDMTFNFTDTYKHPVTGEMITDNGKAVFEGELRILPA